MYRDPRGWCHSGRKSLRVTRRYRYQSDIDTQGKPERLPNPPSIVGTETNMLSRQDSRRPQHVCLSSRVRLDAVRVWPRQVTISQSQSPDQDTRVEIHRAVSSSLLHHLVTSLRVVWKVPASPP